jgi:hypothetical protein
MLQGGNDNPEPIRILWMMSGLVIEESLIVDKGRCHG